MTESSNPSSARRVFGWILTLLGGLWVFLAGSCTLAFMVSQVVAAVGSPGYSASSIGPFLLIGLVCIAPGAGLLIWGLALLRGPRRSS